jgi:hypothetical protein
MPDKNLKNQIGPVKPEIEASAYLDLAPSTLEMDRRTGRLGIPFIRIGRRIGYLINDLDKWLINNRVTPKELKEGDKHDA